MWSAENSQARASQRHPYRNEPTNNNAKSTQPRAEEIGSKPLTETLEKTTTRTVEEGGGRWAQQLEPHKWPMISCFIKLYDPEYQKTNTRTRAGLWREGASTDGSAQNTEDA